MTDVQKITNIAADNLESVQEIIVNVSSSAEELTKAVKGNTNIIKALGSLASTISALIGLIRKNNEAGNKNQEEN